MHPDYQKLLERSAERADFIKRQMKYLGRFDIKNFDHMVADIHDEVFEGIDCTQCGNCCRVHGPCFSEPDIKRITKLVGYNREAWVKDTLQRSEEFGWVLKELPCPFLEGESRCSIYDDKPKDCDAYPYTHERHIAKNLGRLAHNSGICPAAYLIAEKIIERFAKGDTKR